MKQANIQKLKELMRFGDEHKMHRKLIYKIIQNYDLLEEHFDRLYALLNPYNKSNTILLHYHIKYILNKANTN